MFGSDMIDVALGLTLVYLLLSLLATSIREALEGLTKSRAVLLERGIRNLLDDPTGDGLAKRFYEHPLVYSLFPGQYDARRRRRYGRNMPTYIPARNFAVALLDLAVRGRDFGPYAAQHTGAALTIDDLRASAQRIESPFVRRALLAAVDNAQGDVARVQANLEAWFDSAMDRVSGWYRRRTQALLFAIALGMTLALNVNTVTITNYLWRNKAAREAMARRAELLGKDPTYQRLVADTSAAAASVREQYEGFRALGLPMGWSRATLPATAPDWVAMITGLFVTAFAVTLGAPFWFDVLNKIMVVRSTVKPHEKSPEESSEDRQTKKETARDAIAAAAATTTTTTPATATTPTAAPSRPQPPPPAGANGDAVLAGSAAAAYTARLWATGDPEEGIL